MNSTNIECKLHRKGGTTVELDGTEYHFTPLADGAHVATVARDEHISKLLSWPEAYRLYRGEAQAAPAAAPVSVPVAAYTIKIDDDMVAGMKLAEPAALASTATMAVDMHDAAPKFPASFDIHGTAYSLTDVTARAMIANGFAENDWIELSDDMRGDLIEDELDKIDAAGPVAVVTASTPTPTPSAPPATRDELVAQYLAKTGIKPHHKWNADKIRAELAK